MLTLIGVFLGIFVGLLLRMRNPSDEVIMLVSFPGEILVRVLKMLMLPLIVSSLFVGKCIQVVSSIYKYVHCCM